MGKTVVVFQSKYGFTKKYAEWIAKALSCDMFERKQVKWADLENADIIVYGGGIYAGNVGGFDLITKNFDRLLGKNLVLFTCGLFNPKEQDNIDYIKDNLKKSLTKSMEEKIKMFFLRGGMDYGELGFLHKRVMDMIHKMMLKNGRDSLSPGEKDIFDTYKKSVDFTDEKAVEPLITYIQNL